MSLAVASIPLLACPAHAQTQPSGDPAAVPPTEDAPPSADIVVTARQRSERLQEVPIAISAVTGSDLTRTGVQSLQNLSAAVPGLQFGGNAVRLQTFTAMRGVGDYSRNPGIDNRVGIYVDGIYLGRSDAANYPLFDVSQIEVLRGPQGTLFGKDTLTGAINITSVKPSNEFSGRVTVKAGSRDLLQGTAVLNVPLSDKVYLRVSGLGLKQDGYVRNLFNGADLGRVRTYGGRAQLRFVPDDATTIDLTADYIHERSNALLGEPLAFSPVTGAAQPQFATAPRIREVNFNPSPTRGREIYGFALNVERTLGDYQLTSLTSYRRNSSFFFGNDGDRTPADQLSSDNRDFSKAFSQELRLASPSGRRFEYVVGAFFFDDKPSNRWLVSVGNDFPLAALRGGTVRPTGFVETRTLALFGHATYKITDALKLDAGLRFNNVRKSIDYQQLVSSPLVTTVLRFVNIPAYSDRLDDSWVDPTVSLRYAVTSDVNLYATYSHGRRQGGWNADFVQYTDIRFGPEKVESYEAGIKTLLFDRKLRLNLAAYSMRLKDFQITQNIVPPGGSVVAPTITNAGAVSSKGVEAEILLRPGGVFDVSASLNYNDAKFTRFTNGLGENYAGNRLIEAPRFTASLNPRLNVPIGGGATEFRVSADLQYQGVTFSDPSNTANFRQDPRTLVGARVAVGASDNRWELAVSARNLFNIDYIDQASIFGAGSAAVLYNEPRTIAAEATFRF